MKQLLLILVLNCLAPLAQAAGIPAALIDDYARTHGYSGTVLVQEQGKVSYRRSFGVANVAFTVANTPDTVYKAASITKAFTAVLVLQLVEEGRLDLGQPIATYLPDYAGEGARKVSLHQLLNHTSGLANFDQVKDLQSALTQGVPVHQVPATSDQLLSRHCSGALAAEPGKAFDYNNCDYIVLGKILERVTGKTYEELLRARILQPLKLEHSGLLQQARILPKLADSYMYREDMKALANDLPVYSENLYAAGSLYASADDVLAFANALFGGRLLKPASMALMFKPGLDDYGYGVWSYEMTIAGRKERIVKRPGRMMGAQAQLFRMRDADITIVLLANTDAVDLDQMVADLARAAR